jgi:5-methylcytosine-specific restriction endonuclease McrA
MIHPHYQEHLASPDWLAIRADVMQRANYRCQRCGSPWGLQVHHRTYARLGHEQLNDLICLCRDCHRQLHGYADWCRLRVVIHNEDRRAQHENSDSP